VHGRKYPWREEGAAVYEQMIAELLLQRTRADAVALRLQQVLRVIPSWDALVTVSAPQLRSVLKPLGLWKQRVAALKRLAAEIVGRGGELPRAARELETLPAIGQYMANAFIVILKAGRAPYVDVNMARVLERHFGPRQLADIRYDPTLQDVAFQIVNSVHCQVINWAILDLAALVCTSTSPRCRQCPLMRSCAYRKQHAHPRGTKSHASSVTSLTSRRDGLTARRSAKTHTTSTGTHR
jgi:A/G-specific adenine glycosylase